MRAGGDVDLGPLDPRTGRINRGSTVVGANVLEFFGPPTTLVAVPGGGSPLVLAFVASRLSAVLALKLSGGRVCDIHVLADPAKIPGLGQEMSLSS